MLTRLPDIGSSELWLIDLDIADDNAAACLSEDESQRAARFVFARDRRRYIRAHTALRRVLAKTLSVAAHRLVFAQGVAGKPWLPMYPSCHFNLSHSGHLGLVAIDPRNDVGVDIEMLRPIADQRSLGRQHFDADELASIGDVSDPLAFLRCWTRKEACLKAVGTGLDRDLRLLPTGSTAAPRTLQLQVGSGLQTVVVQSFVHGAFVASVAQMKSG